MELRATHLLLFLAFACQPEPEAPGPEPEKATPDGAWAQDFERTKHPDLGYPTPEVLWPVAEAIVQKNKMEGIPGDGQNAWEERGPYDIGGRTRAIMFDPNDPDNKKVWAGGVTGGLWYNNDITDPASEWKNVNDFWSNLSVTCLAADPNNSQIFYAGTGEGWGQGTSGARGAGIWKSTDGGANWNQLSSSAAFYFVNDIVVRNENGTSAVYAGVESYSYRGVVHGTSANGLQQSTNGGSSWSQVLPMISGDTLPFSVADIEIASNNQLWVGTINNRNGLGGGHILNSSDGINWSGASLAGGDRVELATAPSNSNYVYALIESGNVVAGIFRTIDGGAFWNTLTEPSDADNGIPATDFTRGQAWYDLIAAVNPTDEYDLIVGGINLHQTKDGGSSWSQISKWSNNSNMNLLNCALVHADQHQIIYRPGSSTEVVFGTDGGIYFSPDISNAATTNAIRPRNNGYNVTQFYAGAMHPRAAESYYLAGSQDNGTQRFNKAGLESTTQATGGDGGYTHIDSLRPDTQITAFTGNTYTVSFNGGVDFDSLSYFNGGSFINPSDYHDALSLLYTGFGANGVTRVQIDGSPSLVSISMATSATHIRVSPHSATSSTLFVGNGSGELFKVLNADGASPPTSSNIAGGAFPGSTISCVDVAGSEDTLAVTFANYGVTSVWYTTDGGINWVSKEGDLPDMPVRWILMNPNNRDEAMVATELGVWSTANFTSGSPNWTSSNSGLATVRTDMLQYRKSDQQVIAITHGRGLFSSDAWSEKAPVANFQAESEQLSPGMPVQINNLSSSQPTTFSWSFSPDNVVFLEGTSATSETPVVEFTETGSYTVSLTATNSFGSGSETKNSYISVVNPKILGYTQNFDGFSACAISNSCGLTCSLGDGWLNAANGETDESDWITNTGGTPSFNTGPSADFSGSGNYLYIEASGCSHREMTLYSPPIDLINAANPSLSFAYHMYGIEIRELELSVYTGAEWKLLWEAYGNMGNAWQTTTVDLSQISGQEAVFRFRGRTGFDFPADIAIDAFSINETDLRWDGGGASSNWSEAANWTGDVVPNTGATVILDNIYVAGSYTVTMDEGALINGLEVDAGANTINLTGSEKLRVNGVVTPTSGTLASGGRLSLAATSETNYGQVSVGAGSITGTVTNEWYFTGPSGYHHIASPVNCNLSEISSDFSRMQFANNSSGSIWGWDPSVSYWDAPSGPSQSFDEGYSVYLGFSSGLEFSPLPFGFDADGTLREGNISEALTYSVGNASDFVDPNENAGWNFLPNPYPSGLNWDAVANAAGFPTELSATKYTWDPLRDSYSSYNGITQSSVKGGTSHIAKNQAVWIQLSSAPVGNTTSLALTDALRSVSESPKLKSDPRKNRIRIQATQNGKVDEMRMAYFEAATPGYDHRFDHLEMDDGQYQLSVASIGGIKKLAYNFSESYRWPIPFEVTSPIESKVELMVDAQNFINGETPEYLYDAANQVFHKIATGAYSYFPTEGENKEFWLLRRKADLELRQETVSILQYGQMLELVLSEPENFEQFYLFDTAGKLVFSRALNEAYHQYFEIPKSGIFILSLQRTDGSLYTKKILHMGGEK